MGTFPVHPELRVEGFADDDLLAFLDSLTPRSGPGRFAAWPEEGAWRMARAGADVDVRTDDPTAVCRQAATVGVQFDAEGFAAFRARFSADLPVTTVGRIAALIGPVLPDLHPRRVQGIGWDMQPAERTRRIMDIAGRFLPKEHAVAARLAPPTRPRGIALVFDRRRLLIRVVGPLGWPESVRNGATLSDLKPMLGCGVDVGLDIGAAGLQALLYERLNRTAFAGLFAAGELRLDPLPLAARLALKAARIA